MITKTSGRSLASAALAGSLFALACQAGPATAPAEIELPGEKAEEVLPVPPFPFPDRLSAYVWKNWFVVPHDRLARVVGASERQLEEIAAQMGLPRKAAVLPEWRRDGYITVLRRNWHLLDYPQLLALLEMDRKELYFSLMHEDFLWHKLGMVKPTCGPLEYSPGTDTDVQDRRRIAAVLKEEGLLDFDEEPRFSFIRDLKTVDPTAAAGASRSKSPFDLRLIFSYFADYADPLADPEVDSFPEGLLQKLSAQGVNAVWLHTVLGVLAKDPKYPEFGEGSENRLANLRTLVARCAKYGIKVYLYMNEPRAQPPSFFKAQPWRAGMKGSPQSYDGTFAMCTSDPETLRWLRDSVRRVYAAVPGLGGMFTITMSENLTNCASRERKDDCPRCRGRSVADIVTEVNLALIEGMRAGDPRAEAIVWNWAWPDDAEASVLARLPREGCRVMAVSEGRMDICKGGVPVRTHDYSISCVGPSDLSRRFWKNAAAKGLPTVAKVQANTTWELCTVPYLPVMDLVAEHASNLVREGVGGVMLSWSLGCAPSPNLRVFNEIGADGDRDAVLNRLASDLYGEAAVKDVRAAWKAFSDGFREFPFSLPVVYYGPMQWGSAAPLYPARTGYASTMVGLPYDDLAGWCRPYPPAIWIDLMQKTADGFMRGCTLWNKAISKMSGPARRTAEREAGLFRAAALHFASSADLARFVQVRDTQDWRAVARIARREKVRARAAYDLVRADSRIGFESSNHYFFIPQDLREKIVACRILGDADCGRDSVRVSDFGRDPVDATRILQRALDSGARTVTIDKAGSPWQTGPLNVRSNTEIIFEDGAELQARKGLFLDPWDSLLNVVLATNVVIRGEGSGGTVRMRKLDYRRPPYKKEEHRHALNILSAGDVRVEKMSFIASGGDGIYIGEDKVVSNACRRVVIRDCLCDDNHRQGISVISADGLLIERTVMQNTEGTDPQSGIDIEPNNTKNVLRDIVLRDCITRNNMGNGYQFAVCHLASNSVPVTITMENCQSLGDNLSPILHAFVPAPNKKGSPKGGFLKVRGCRFADSNRWGVETIDKQLGHMDFSFEDCVFENNSRATPEESEFKLVSRSPGYLPTDGITFKNVRIIRKIPMRDGWLSLSKRPAGTPPMKGLSGDVTVTVGDNTETVRVDRAYTALRYRTVTDKNWMRGSIGIGVHWTAQSVRADGTQLPFEEAVERFDVRRFADQLEAAGAQHCIFTVCHALQLPPCPSAVIDRLWPGHTCKRDLLGEIIRELGRRGIRFIAYYNHSCNKEEMKETEEWKKACSYPCDGNGGSMDVFADNICAIVEELSRRYGKGISGWWFDSSYSVDSSGPHKAYQDKSREWRFPWTKLAAAARSGNPDAQLAVNAGIDEHHLCMKEASYAPGECIKFDAEFPPLPQGIVDHRWICADSKRWVFNRKQADNGGFVPLRLPAGEMRDWMQREKLAGRMVTMNVLIDQDGTFSPALEELTHDPKTVYVDPRRGGDNNLGQTPLTAFATLDAAMEALRPGDTLRLAPGAVFRAPFELKKNGTARHPIVIEGNGAVISGLRPVPKSKWQEKGAGLWLSPNGTFWGACRPRVFDADRNLISLPVEHPAFKDPSMLQAGQAVWNKEGIWYRPEPGSHPRDAKLSGSYGFCGLLAENKSYWTVRDLVCEYASNDGFNLHGMCRGMVFQNIVARWNGDDGFSIHEDVAADVSGLHAHHNDYGIQDVSGSQSYYSGCVIESNRLSGVSFMGGMRTLRDAVVSDNARAQISLHPSYGESKKEPTDAMMSGSFYLESVRTKGGTTSLSAAPGTSVTARNCLFTDTGTGLKLRGCKAFLQNCRVRGAKTEVEKDDKTKLTRR